MLQFGIIILAILGLAVIEMFVDKQLGIDFSTIPPLNRVIHGFIYKLSGAVIAATIWFL